MVARTVQGAMGEAVRTGFGLIEDGGTAIVEMAMASGLALVEERDAWNATHVWDRGVDRRRGPGGCGGDPGGGRAVGDDRRWRGGDRGDRGHRGDRKAKIGELCDVRTTWEDAPKVFGPQKGADDGVIKRLERRLDGLAQHAAEGPAGGRRRPVRAGGLEWWAVGEYGEALEPGRRSCSMRWTSTSGCAGGERSDRRGKLEVQMLQGKLVGDIGARTRQAGVPLHAIRAHDALDGFGKLTIDLQMVQEARTSRNSKQAG